MNTRLIGTETAWILRQGSAEVFVTSGISRRPLGLVDAPGCLFGTGREDLVIEAKLSEEAEVEEVSFERLLAEPDLMQLCVIDTHVLLAGIQQREAPPATPKTLEGMVAFQEAFNETLGEGMAAMDLAGINRQQSKAAQNARAMQTAATRLSNVLLEASESGQTGSSSDPLVAALRLVGAVIGLRIEAHPMASSFPTVALRIQATVRASRCRARPVTLSGQWWKGENGPLLGFAGDGRAVALIPAGRGYRIEDPQGRYSGRVDEKMAEEIMPQAYTLYRGFGGSVITWKNILTFVLRDNVADLGLIAVLAAVVGLLGLVTPKATQLIFDYAIPGGLESQLWQLGAGMFAAALGTAAFSLAQGFLLLRVESKADRDVQSGVMDRLLRLPAPFFRLYSVGDLANRALSIDSIRQIISAIGVTTLMGAISSLFNFYILFKYGWQLSILAVCLSLTAMLAAIGVNLWSLRYARVTENLDGAIDGLVNQLITGIAKLRVTGTAAQAFALWAGRFAERSRLHLRMRRIQNILTVFNVAFPSICTLLIFWFAFKKIAAGGPGFTTGDFLAYNTAFGAFLGAALSFSDATIRAVMIIPLYERASPILSEPPESGGAQAWPGELTGDIDLRHVTFRYAEDGPTILNDVNLTIRPGEFIAVVGPSGSGKSTLLRLLLGFESPESGAIYYNGQALETIDSIELRRQIGVVLQSGRPLVGDIFHNIASITGASLDEAWAAAELAGFAEDIRAMPMGMYTIVSEEGGGLSGGQRQRLMIARAVVNNPRILFFDEATSALDNETQAHVTAGLDRLQATRLVIAHRLSTIAHADRIIVMRDGRIVEEGSYADLMEKKGFFFELANRQLS